jgi:CRISPR-associated protein (TIGR03986 family)
MSPKHIDEVPEFIKDDKPRRAVAPYNFVELPEKVVEAEPLPSGDRYHLNRHTGTIECTLTTESPIYIRCGLTTEEFKQKQEKEAKYFSDFFYTDSATKLEKPVLPGSSLRGMLRTLVEIVSFSKIEKVSGHQRLFFRAVGSNHKKESWGKEYKQYVNPQIIKAGYLKKDREIWYIQPAVEKNGITFAWVEESELTNLPKFKKFDEQGYKPQYFDVSYDSLEQKKIKKNGKLIAEPWFASNINLQEINLTGKLVTSGNMKQTEDDNSPRCNHCIVFTVDKKAKPLPIDDTAIEHYRNALTDFQKASPFDKDWGVLEEDRPVFYYHDGKSETVGFVGQSPNFRIPYSPEGNGHATTVLDFIPKNLRDLVLIDLADAIFGWVKQESENEKLPKGFDKQRASRIFVTDGLYESNQNGIWYSETPVTPQILSEPKPSYFPHYLVQPSADKSELKHYASEPVTKTVIRGHKLYWHKGSNPDFKLPPPPTPKKVIDLQKKVLDTHTSQVSDTQTTQIKPIKQGVVFKFDIYFENLSDVELGALLWVLDIAKNDNYRLSLGMGKPLGLGAVKIEPTLHLSRRQKRYEKLFDSNNSWEKGEIESSKDLGNYVSKFENYMLEKLNHTGDFKNLCRIKMLLAMLSWPGITDVENNTRYMEITRDKKPRIGDDPNEYKQRPVLPDPLDVMREVTGIKIECDRPSSSLPIKTKTPKQPMQQFSEGQEIDAKVVNIKEEGQKQKIIITYEIKGSDCLAKEESYKQKVSLAVGDILKVSILKVQGKNIRKVKRV